MTTFTGGTSSTATTTSYIHTDHLGSTNVVTDENGELAQTIDYYPFGSLRIDDTTSVDEKRKFTGHEFDRETELTYANARYYDQDIGRWVSLDPASRDNPNQFLRDPQQLNTYSYGRNNPLVFIDRDGKKVELVTKSVGGAGAHAFILITNTQAGAARLTGLPANVQDPTRITLGGYPSIRNPLLASFGNLVKGANRASDYDLSESKYIERVDIFAPPQYNGDQAAFENAILGLYGELDDELGAYSVFGSPGFNGQANSNNVISTILGGVGVDNSITRGYRPLQLHPYRTPGLGTSLPSVRQRSFADGLKGIIGALTAFRDSLKSAIESNSGDKN